MTTTIQTQFTKDLLQVLKETFEGPDPIGPSAFLNKGTGLFQTLDDVSWQEASAKAREDSSTIAAHTEHIRFYVMVHYNLMLGSTDEIDWDKSWRIKTVTSSEWDSLRRDLRKSYSIVTGHLVARGTWSDEEAGLTVAIIGHTAYHLGAIRQLVLAVQQQSES